MGVLTGGRRKEGGAGKGGGEVAAIAEVGGEGGSIQMKVVGGRMTGGKKTKRNKKRTITMRDLRRRMDVVYPII